MTNTKFKEGDYVRRKDQFMTSGGWDYGDRTLCITKITETSCSSQLLSFNEDKCMDTWQAERFELVETSGDFVRAAIEKMIADAQLVDRDKIKKLEKELADMTRDRDFYRAHNNRATGKLDAVRRAIDAT